MPVRLVHKDAPGHFEPLNADQEALFRSQGWVDEKPARRTSPKSSEPVSASGSSDPDGSSPADTEKE